MSVRQREKVPRFFFYTRYLLFVRQNLFVRAVPLSCRLPLLLSACGGSCVAAVTRTGTVSSADVFFAVTTLPRPV